MQKLMLNSLLLLLSLISTSSAQQNFSIENNIKEANSTSFVKKEKIKPEREFHYLELQSFDLKPSDYKDKNAITFNFKFDKDYEMFSAYLFYLVDIDGNYIKTLKTGFLHAPDRKAEATLTISKDDVKGLGNNFYLRIGEGEYETIPFQLVFFYIDIPLSNIRDLQFESNSIDFVVGISYDMKYLTITREYLEFLNIEKDVYIDTYEKFVLDGIDCAYQSNDVLPAYDANMAFYLYDPKHLFYSAFTKVHPTYKDYYGTSVFFGSTYDSVMHTLRTNSIFYVDPTTLISFLLRGNLTNYFRASNVIYFPMNYYETFKDTKCLIRIQNYGSSGATLEYQFTLHFAENFNYDKYYVEVVDSVKDWELSPEVVTI